MLLSRYDSRVAELRVRLKGLRDGLIRLHKSLLDSERAAYERDVARITSTGQYLQLVLEDPWFQWLRELSQLVVLIDETLGEKDPALRDTVTLRDRDSMKQRRIAIGALVNTLRAEII